MSKKTQRERQERLFRQKLVIIGGVTAGLLCVVAVIAFQIISTINKENEIPAEDKKIIDTSIRTTKENGELREKAKTEIKNNDVAKARDVYAQAVDSTGDIKRKVELYVDLANLYYDAGKPNEAIDAAKKAADLGSDKFLAADWLSRAYEDQKNYAEAVKYYRLASEWVVSPQNTYNFDKAYYDGEIVRVEQLLRGVQ